MKHISYCLLNLNDSHCPRFSLSSATQFDIETAERLMRIRSTPNPRSFIGRLRIAITWIRALDRRRCYEAARALFAIVGATGYAGYFASMHVVMAVFSLAILLGTWYAIYCFMERAR